MKGTQMSKDETAEIERVRASLTAALEQAKVDGAVDGHVARIGPVTITVGEFGEYIGYVQGIDDYAFVEDKLPLLDTKMRGAFRSWVDRMVKA